MQQEICVAVRCSALLASLGLLLAALVPGRQPSAALTLPAAIRWALPAGYTVLDKTLGDLHRNARPS
jgi:hypothetical protein